jgi:ubiquinone/menaquinone biosynthesis C-methylase UbiE
MYGDFHRLEFPDGSLDAVYTNALDHVWDIEGVIREVRRVLRPGGAFIADILPGFEEGFTPGEYESTLWRTIDYLVERICAGGGFAEESRVDLGEIGRDRWYQVVLRTLPQSSAASASTEDVRRDRR